MKKAIVLLLSASVGFLFIISSITKIYPMEPFEFQFVDIGIANWKTAPYLARVFISLEFFLGILLVLNIAIRKFTIKFAIALLSVFSFYLLYKIISVGNTGNCGCFGEYFKMSPLEGIIKNIVLIISCVLCYLLSDFSIWKNQHLKFVVPLLLLISLCIGFFLYPINIQYSSSIDTARVNYKVPLDLMYSATQKERPNIELRKGKHIVAFLSLTCSHCRVAAQKLAIIHKRNPALPIYFALNGNKKKLPTFFDETHSKAIPHNLFLGPENWIKVAGVSLPIVMYLENSIVVKKCILPEIDQEDMEVWMAK